MLANDHSMPVQSGSLTTTVVSSSTDSVVLQSPSQHRRALYIYNHGSGSLYVRLAPDLDSSASFNTFTTKVASGSLYEMSRPVYLGHVHGIWDEADGAAMVTQLEVSLDWKY